MMTLTKNIDKAVYVTFSIIYYIYLIFNMEYD